MSRKIAPVMAAAAGAALLLTACTGAKPTANPAATSAPPATTVPVATATAAPPTTAAATPVPVATAAYPRNPAPIVEGTPYTQPINPAAFVAGVDNPFLPFAVGASFVFEGDEHVEVKVLSDTKLILGVNATVVSDRVFQGGVLIEDTLDYYAQDVDGNVWYFGEQTAEYKNGKVSSTAGSWIGGVDGALPGIVMLADPQVGDEYRQEFKAGEAEDLGAVTATSGSISVPAGSWSGADVLVTEEWTPLEPDVREQKTYARGFGVVESKTIKGGNELTQLQSMATAALPMSPTAAFAGLGLIALAWRRRGT